MLGSLQAGLVEIYRREGYELGRQVGDGHRRHRVRRRRQGGRLARRVWRAPNSKAPSTDVLERYGFRGVNEWEIASPSWEIRPEVLRRAVDAVRAGGAERDPEAIRAAALARSKRTRRASKFADFDLWFERCKVWMGVRERTKATCVLTINEQRLDALRDRTSPRRRRHARGAPEDVYFMTLDDLTEAVEPGSVYRELIDDRRAAAGRARASSGTAVRHRRRDSPCRRVAAEGGRDRPDRRRRGDRRRRREPGPGDRTGPVIRNAYADEPTEPGEVLVAPITDPGWMHLFVGAVAVVAEMGGELSHTMIVSRDLGIPAVVGAVGATSAIRTGTW